MKKFVLLFNTLKYLRCQQIYFRFVRKLIKPKITEIFQGLKLERSKTWKHVTLYDDKIDSQFKACFLNHTKQLDLPADWNNESCSKLWVYNLHYFEDLLSENAKEKQNFHLHLLNIWVDQNPVGYGNGWEPYPTSLRIVNILKAWLGGLELNINIFKSVFEQSSFLSNNLEKHLLGNHYFVNLKALLFAGVIFQNKRWLNIAEKGLLSEIPEQILEDGANFELSPMYHSLILVDMLDIFNLSKAYPSKLSAKLVAILENFIPKMLLFMKAMQHPDGGVSFFNDSVEGIAPINDKIERYAERLGFKISSIDFNKDQIIDNARSGYMCVTSADNKLIFDASPIGPDYIPGHSHADTLSFELSIGTQRVFVNSGISMYGHSRNRTAQRKTFSHNTVEIDNKDSSQVWSGFRVGNRAKIINRGYKLLHDGGFEIQASHNGYKNIFGGCVHQRTIIIDKGKFQIKDTIFGKFQNAKSRIFIHPSCNVDYQNNLLTIKLQKNTLTADMSDLDFTLNDSSWHPEFGKKLRNKVLEIKFIQAVCLITFNIQS